MEKIFVLEDEELKELVSHIHKNNQIRFFIFGGFLLLSLLLKWMDITVPWTIIQIIIALFLTNVLTECLVKKVWPKQTVTKVSLEYLTIQIIEVIFILAGIHFFGAVVTGGVGVLMVYIIFWYLAFTRNTYPRIIALICTVGYVILGFLEYFGVLEFQDVTNLGVNLVQDWDLFITNITWMVGFLICLAFYGDVFSKRLRDSIKILRIKTSQLTKKEEELGKAKATLEIKVQARTKELKELTEGLDIQVKQRTKELEEKIKELEKFQKLAVGRELKMVELKKEIKKLEELLKQRSK